MSTQLRLVEPPEGSRPARRTRGRATRARATTGTTTRAIHWDGDWQLDATSRRAGREGVAAARAALARARRPDEELSEAS